MALGHTRRHRMLVRVMMERVMLMAMMTTTLMLIAMIRIIKVHKGGEHFVIYIPRSLRTSSIAAKLLSTPAKMIGVIMLA